MQEPDQQRIASKIAKTLAMMCVRNTLLEDFHSGISPVTKTGDYSDVKVIDAEGQEIPWNEVSRLDDDEMKALMKQVVNRLYTWFAKTEDMTFQDDIDRWISAALKWDDPELDQSLLRTIEQHNIKLAD